MSHGTEVMRRVIAVTASPYPASFDGSTLRFGLALFSLMSISIVALMTWGWMVREMWKERHGAYPWESLFALRFIFTAMSFTTVIRCAPEATYMLAYREASASAIITILYIKRWCDASAFVPSMTWMTLIWAFYIPICGQLTTLRRVEGVSLRPKVSRQQLKRMGAALALTFAISALIAIGKR